MGATRYAAAADYSLQILLGAAPNSKLEGSLLEGATKGASGGGSDSSQSLGRKDCAEVVVVDGRDRDEGVAAFDGGDDDNTPPKAQAHDTSCGDPSQRACRLEVRTAPLLQSADSVIDAD